MILSHTGHPQTTDVTAITMPAKPIIDPTDRSNSPAIISRQAPTAIIINWEDTIPQFIEPSRENIPVSRATKKTIIGGVTEVAENDWLAPIFGGEIFTGVFDWLGEKGLIQTFVAGTKAGQPVVSGIPMMIVWAIGLVIFAHFLLTKTRFGNWIYASGGDAQAARHIGVPVNRVKILMFVFTAFSTNPNI